MIAEVERSGLRGRGGAGFPTATKLAAVARGRRTVVVVNATEGEPRAARMRCYRRWPRTWSSTEPFSRRAPSVLPRCTSCVERGGESANDAMAAPLEERARPSETRSPCACTRPPTVTWLAKSPPSSTGSTVAKLNPLFVPPRPFERGVRGRPTLVQNAETLAHIALIARRGAAWFRELGTQQEPGTALVTVAGAVARPGVCEVPIGYPLVDILGVAGTAMSEVSAVLVGGYCGTWLSPAAASRTTYDRASLGAAEASPGCGVVAALSRDACGMLDLARVACWLGNENAGQCGPCVNGLPAIADAVQPSTPEIAAVVPNASFAVGWKWCRDGAHASTRMGWRASWAAVFGPSPTTSNGIAATAPAPHHIRFRRCPRPGDGDDIRTRLFLVEESAINPITCMGHGLCAELFPEWITLDDWGYPIIDPHPIPRRVRLHAKRAIEACPTLAPLLRTPMPLPQ